MVASRFTGPSLRVAVTQAESVWLDLKGSVEKTLALVSEAAQGGAKLIAFPECWITGYPAWIWTRPVDPALHTRYILNSLRLDSPEMESIKVAAKEHSICVVLGFSERTETNSLYIAQAIISPQGDLVMHRRKLKPTHMERTIFGDGSGSDLDNVVLIDFGGDLGKIKIGALACWEHTQPLLKYHTYSKGEVIHISMWPPVDPHGGEESPALFSMSAEGCFNLSQTYAIEGGSYVLHSTAVWKESGIETMRTAGGCLFGTPGGGHSAVVGPDGRRLSKPLEEGDPSTEGIIYADLDLMAAVTTSAFLDVVGHYSRPDLLWLGVDKQQKQCVVANEGIQR